VAKVKIRQWIEKDEFEGQILRSSTARIVLFAADWCGYCRRFLGMASEYDLKSKMAPVSSCELEVVNIDSGDGSLWDSFDVKLVPTLLVLQDGKQIFRRDGRPMRGLGKEDLEDALKAISSAQTV
jgi:thiol-disulfide isomerase/thioredoxin